MRSSTRVVIASAAAAVVASCFHDYDQFDLAGGDDAGAPAASGGTLAAGAGGSVLTGGGPAAGSGGGITSGGGTGGITSGGGTAGLTGGTGGASGGTGGATGGSSGSGGIGTGGLAGSGGSSTGGSGGSSGCGGGEKLCETDCVVDADPLYGCAAVSCDPCSVLNATPACGQGLCVAGACDPGFADCDGATTLGCEHSLAAASDTRCGGCSADCTTQGAGFVCQNLGCECTNAEQCRVANAAAYTCTPERVCECGGTTCQRGEACARESNSSRCSCNGGAACVVGTVCCPGGADNCVDLAGSPGNCGACGWVCPTGWACAAGTCVEP